MQNGTEENESTSDKVESVIGPKNTGKPKVPVRIRIALAGNPNVGKSVIFNKITGLNQMIGNWPGKTVKKMEGRARFGNYIFELIDLPGIYSLSTYSLEEIVSREYILEEKPDYIVNVIDSNHLERNLFFTLQLMMLNRPMIISLNQYDLLKKRGFEIDIKKLEELLGVPVIRTVAVHNRGVHEILERIIRFEESGQKPVPKPFKFGKEIESRLDVLERLISERIKDGIYPTRFAALKILENDESCLRDLGLKNGKFPEIIEEAEKLRKELEEIHGEHISTVINAEFYKIAAEINDRVLTVKKRTRKEKWSEIVDHLTVHSVIGYFILFTVLFGTYYLIFSFGDAISEIADGLTEFLTPYAASVLGGEDSALFKIVWNGLFGGFMGGVGGVLPYVIPFFFFIEILQDIGYLPRAAYLMDHFMHKIGVHGKTIIPILLGFGCNVPAVSAAMIMENEKEKRRSILISSMIPCSAVSTIVLGLVGKYMGIVTAFVLYLVNFTAIIIVGKVLTVFGHTEESELIIELHDFRIPNFGVIIKQTWIRSKEFVTVALPLMVILGAVIQVMIEFGIFTPVNYLLLPVTVFLGLPFGTGIFLFYGFLRKELNLVLMELAVASMGLTLDTYMTPIQMVVFTVVTMIYVPCLATIITVAREAGRKFAAEVAIIETGLAVIIGGIIRGIYECLALFGIDGIPGTYTALGLFFITSAVIIFLIGKFGRSDNKIGEIPPIPYYVKLTGLGCSGKCGNRKICTGCPEFGKSDNTN